MKIMFGGTSMLPILRAGDILEVRPYGTQAVRRGDVIVFSSHGQGGRRVVHRAIRVRGGGIVTRGDNSDRPDALVLSPDEVIGRVISADRDGRRLTVHGGGTGLVVRRGALALRRVRQWMSRILGPAYRRVSRGAPLSRFLPSSLSVRMISIRRAKGTEHQILLGTRVVGRLPPGSADWLIRPPYRLFVNEASLSIFEGSL